MKKQDERRTEKNIALQMKATNENFEHSIERLSRAIC